MKVGNAETAATKKKTEASFRFSEALKKELTAHVLPGVKGVRLAKRPALEGFHRTRVQVLPMTVGSRSTYAWYNPSTRQVMKEIISSSVLTKSSTTTWVKLNKLPA